MNLIDAQKMLSRQISETTDVATFAYINNQITALMARGENPADYSLALVSSPQYMTPQDGVELRVSMELRIIKTSQIYSDGAIIKINDAIDKQLRASYNLGYRGGAQRETAHGLEIMNIGRAAGMDYDQIKAHMQESARAFAQYGDRLNG